MEKQLNSSGIFSTGFSTLQINQKILDDFRERNIDTGKIHRPDHLHVNVQRHRLGQRKGMMEFAFRIVEKVKDCAKRFLQEHWTFLGPGEEKKWCGTLPIHT